MINVPLTIAASAIGCTLLYASYLDVKERRVPFKTWHPMLAISIPLALWAYASSMFVDPRFTVIVLALVGVFCAAYYLLAAYLRLFGGADAWALIFITICIPFYPIEPLMGYPLLAFFPFTVFLNALILNLATPLGIFAYNVLNGHRAPIRYMFVGIPVDGSTIENTFGFVIEDIQEQNGVISRHFIRFRDAISGMVSGEKRLYTKDLKRYPEEYARERALFRKSGSVWISYGVPFIVPIFAGFLTAIFFGDILFTIMDIFIGV